MDPLAQRLLIELAVAFLRSRGEEPRPAGTVKSQLTTLLNEVRRNSQRLQEAFGEPDALEEFRAEMVALRALVTDDRELLRALEDRADLELVRAAKAEGETVVPDFTEITAPADPEPASFE